MREKTGIFLVTSTNVTILIFLVLSKTAFGFKGVSGNRLRSSVEISDRFFTFILCLTGFCRDKSSEGHTTYLFEIFELFSSLDLVSEKNIAHSCMVMGFSSPNSIVWCTIGQNCTRICHKGSVLHNVLKSLHQQNSSRISSEKA